MRTKTIVFTALLTALAVIIKILFDVSVPVAGVQALRISFAGVFLRFASVVFGPFAGGASAGLADVIKHFIKPEGAYLPPLTVTAIINGILVALLWRLVKNAEIKKYRVFFAAFFVLLGCWGIINTLTIKFASGGFYLDFLRQIGVQNELTNTSGIFISFQRVQATVGPVIISAAALITFAAVKKIPKSDFLPEYLRILFATGVPCLLYTTVNTEILRMYFLLPEKAFLLLWIPRFIEEAIMVMLNGYLLYVLMRAFKKVYPDTDGLRGK